MSSSNPFTRARVATEHKAALDAVQLAPELSPSKAHRARVVTALRKQEVLDGVHISNTNRAVHVRIEPRRGRQFHVETVRLCLEAEGITAWPSSIEEGTLITSVPAS